MFIQKIKLGCQVSHMICYLSGVRSPASHVNCHLYLFVFTESAPWLIQSIGCNVLLCVYVFSWFMRGAWRLLSKEIQRNT